MRLRLMVWLTVAISVIWLASWMLGLPVTQSLATLLAIPYGATTAYLAWQHVRANQQHVRAN